MVVDVPEDGEVDGEFADLKSDQNSHVHFHQLALSHNLFAFETSENLLKINLFLSTINQLRKSENYTQWSKFLLYS